MVNLGKGLNFSLPLNKLDYSDYLIPFEFLHCKVINEASDTSNFTGEHFKTRLKDIALSSCKNYSPPNFLLSRDDFDVLKKLRTKRRSSIGTSNRKNLTVSKPSTNETNSRLLNEE